VLLQAHNIAAECRAAATLQMSTDDLQALACEFDVHSRRIGRRSSMHACCFCIHMSCCIEIHQCIKSSSKVHHQQTGLWTFNGLLTKFGDGARVLLLRTEHSSETCAHICIAAIHVCPSD